ncbi:hypothetical protein M413DRAFT_323768 [Hebeloma cylindrosporum]|uniref:Uncharacterized protein n=1 Tax=Hebeloma cylindrosporum TaxID=76867 RepID=A0A0C2Y4F3_HEBCY|nr:hypothetical protein M413DRAFT_323768 [Hebeloma cylindrosporum h7]
MMLRVYALHLKNRRVAAFLAVVFFSKVALECVMIPRTVFHVPYDPICDTAKIHPDVIYFSISIWFIHISLSILTVAKWNLVKMGVPVVKLIARDGALTTLSICCTLKAML